GQRGAEPDPGSRHAAAHLRTFGRPGTRWSGGEGRVALVREIRGSLRHRHARDRGGNLAPAERPEAASDGGLDRRRSGEGGGRGPRERTGPPRGTVRRARPGARSSWAGDRDRLR